jgi:dihydroorotate dehydrogenase electron transfer subunit
MKQFTGTIISNEPLCADLFEMKFLWNAGADLPEPGRFFTVRTSDSSVPLLRRPFAFSAFDKKKLSASMIYQKRGPGTGLLTAKGKNDRLDIIGPLGKPFPLPQKGQKALLVAGGIGLGPVLFLAATLARAGIPYTLIFGCRTAAGIPDSAGFSALRPHVCTDDGSSGFKGTTTDYLAGFSKAVDASTLVYACGPRAMLKGCHGFARAQGLVCYVSVEQIMACGVGACMGCAVKVNREPGFARACVEGPVFDSNDINWDV